jgi:hypothetical protein
VTNLDLNIGLKVSIFLILYTYRLFNILIFLGLGTNFQILLLFKVSSFNFMDLIYSSLFKVFIASLYDLGLIKSLILILKSLSLKTNLLSLSLKTNLLSLSLRMDLLSLLILSTFLKL